MGNYRGIKKTKINTKPKVKKHLRPYEVMVGDGMYLGLGAPTGGNPIRVIMIRKAGMCRYCLWGAKRGRVVMGVWGFFRIRMLTEKEMDRVDKAIKLYKQFA